MKTRIRMKIIYDKVNGILRTNARTRTVGG